MENKSSIGDHSERTNHGHTEEIQKMSAILLSVCREKDCLIEAKLRNVYVLAKHKNEKNAVLVLLMLKLSFTIYRLQFMKDQIGDMLQLPPL